MRIETKKIEHVLLIKPIDKRLAVPVSMEFKEQLVNFIEEGHYFILLNLSELDFIDSAGLGAIISIFHLLFDKGTICLCEIPVGIKSLFTITRMDRVFVIYPSEQEGLEEMLKQM